MSPLLLFYFGIIFERVMRLSVGYNEFQVCLDTQKFVIHKFQNGLKPSVDPCTDFYEHGCGNWRKNNPIPKGYVMWTTFKQIQYETSYRVHELLIKKIEKNELPFIKIAKKYHLSCMNEERIEIWGLNAMKKMIRETGYWPIVHTAEIPLYPVSYKRLTYTWQYTYSAYNKLYGFSNIFRLAYKQDEQDQNHNVFLISQTADNEKQFLKDTCPQMNMGKMIYIIRAFVDKTIHLGLSKLKAAIRDITEFERKVGELPSKGKLTRMTIAELQNFYNSFTEASVKINWLDIIKSNFQDFNIVINATEPVIVNKEFFREMALLLDVTEQHTIVNYLQWNMVCRLMKYLNKGMRYIESNCDKNCNVAPRWLTCVEDQWMRDISSYLYVKTYISADVLKAVSKMIDEIKAEIKESIALSPWINDNWKNYMIDKLDKVLSYIGYPKWYDNETASIEHYRGLELGKNYFENLLSIVKHERKKLYAAVRDNNKDMYYLSIYSIVAEDDSWENKIVIPPAIIQYPFFTFNRPSALNYGALGFLIGHQLAHSLNMEKIRTWKCFYNYFNNMTHKQGILDVQGDLISYRNISLTENIPDIIGLQAAFATFQKIKAKTESLSKLWVLGNITDEQLFFLSFANVMCTSTSVRDFILKFSGNIPEKFRVIGTLSNMKSFSETFDCQLDSPMNPLSKCKIWEFAGT